MSAIPYSARDNVLAANGVPLKGFGDGDWFSFEPASDAVTMQTGSDGEVSFSQQNNESGTATLTLMDGSEGNDTLQTLFDAKTVFTLTLTDLNGSASFFCGDAMVAKCPPLTRGRDNGSVEWMIVCGHARVKRGAATRVGI